MPPLLRVSGAIKTQTGENISLSNGATSAIEIGLDALERELAAGPDGARPQSL